MAISFPYPSIGSATRSPGQGCSTCVHRVYCQAFYWYYRNANLPSDTGKRKDSIDRNLGTACTSWSDDINDRITEVTQDDIAENTRLAVTENILREPFDSGLGNNITGDGMGV